jgi:short-subunit dehydrogenase
MASFTGKTVLLTGASEGIGRALAIELSAGKPNLALAARSVERLAEVAAECTARGAQVLTVPMDVTDPDACRGFVEQSLAQFGSIDVVVNNAGVTMWARFDEITDLRSLKQVMDVNYFGSVYLTAAALPHLKQSRGLIVAVASVAGLTGVPERTGYAASKHAMVGFFESLRIELAGSGVDVTIVAPYFVVSQIHRRALGADGRPLGSSPMQEKQIMTAETCARLIRGAMERRERLVFTSWRERLGLFVKLVMPRVIDNIAARAIRRHY